MNNTMNISTICNQIRESIAVKQAILSDVTLLSQIDEAARLMIYAVQSGNKILFAGNGGSAADAQHLAGELINRFNYDRRPLPGLALTANTSVLTAIGNDYGYEYTITRQITGLAHSGDIFLAISTSGDSKNLVLAVEEARRLKVITIGMTGANGGYLKDCVDICLCIPSVHTPRIQESHIVVGHIICDLIESTCCPQVNNL